MQYRSRGANLPCLTVTLTLLVCLSPNLSANVIEPRLASRDMRGFAQWIDCLHAAARRLHPLTTSPRLEQAVPTRQATSWAVPAEHRRMHSQPALPLWLNLPPPTARR